ncbi:SulP family inorganic anion transporter [Streptomyces sp. NBC_00015]
MPARVALRDHRRARLTGDLLAAVTVAAYRVPQVMAYAGAAGLPPVAGLPVHRQDPPLLFADAGDFRRRP